MKFQYDASEAFATLYKPIESGEDPEIGHQAVETPAKYMQKCLGLQKEYSDERTDLAQEVEMISTKLIRPAEDAKQRTKLLHKTLKHRDNMKLDYERYLSRAEHVRKKETRNAKEESALATHEANLAQAQISYQTADDQVKETFPPVSAAVLSLLPYLLANQVMLQTTLVGQLYTVLDGYTRKFGFANPAPPDSEIVNKWDSEFTSLRKELEGGISVIAQGKTVHLNMALPAEKEKGTVTGFGLRNKVMNKKDGQAPQGIPNRTPTSSTTETFPQPNRSQDELAPPKPPRPGGMPSPRIPSPANSPQPERMPSPSINLASKPSMGRIPSNDMLSSKPLVNRTVSNGTYGQQSTAPYPHTPLFLTQGYPRSVSGGATPPTNYQTPPSGTSPLYPTTSNSAADYFGNRRPSQASSIASSAASIAAAKKKPPPPVPAKRLPSYQAQYVTALFDFDGQNAGDLTFREGDKIRVVKKTDSTDDWWDGELRGRTGAFPANYVQQ